MADPQSTSYLDLPDDALGGPPDLQEVSEEQPAQEETVVEQPVVEEVNTEETSDIDKEEENTDDSATSTENVEQSEEKEITEPVSEEKPKEAEIDYKTEYERLVAPFKANGRDIAVRSVDDAIALMQMGANYSKKMAGLKPHLRLVKMLEKNGLLDEQKLSYLIDLNGRNPEAIAKLVKDSGLDPMEMDTEKADGYKPRTHQVDDREIELDMVLEEIKESPSYQRTLSEVSNEWDAASKQVVAGNPQLLKVINSHMDMGVYDLIRKEVDNERVFGRLQGLSDIEAYRKVGDAIQAKGGFDHLAKGHQTPPKQVVVAPKTMQAQDDRLKDKKRAAAPSKPAVTTQVAKEFNPLALSDEEFSKFKPSFL